MIFKCKICGGSLDVKQGERVVECEYCGVKQTIPGFIEPKTQEMYNRANAYLMNNEFDKAENLYNQILFENKEDADAYWNVLMCRYGVTYVKDPASGKYIPTCNRTLYASILNDENYHKAIQYADEKQKALYIENAQTIDDIQKGILSVSQKEKPFDIFISYKETDASGARTKDSIKAQNLYDKLTAEGYKVFFSRITLEDKIGTEYEPYIYAALASSKVMITVSSSRENLEAVWVKNEWSRYLSFAGKDSDKTLIPIYFDMDKNDLPEDFVHLPAYDMTIDGFEQELIRGIKKLIPLPVMLLEKKKKRNAILKKVRPFAIAAAVIAVAVAIFWFAKIPAYNEAMQLYYDKNYPEATWAFDDLGGYRNSKDMKEKAELSWRKSLATVATEDYYITSNGNIEALTEDLSSDAFHNNFQIGKGKEFISISQGDTYAFSNEDDSFVNEDEPFVTYNSIDVIYNDGSVQTAFARNVYENESESTMLKSEQDVLKNGDNDWRNIVQIIHISDGISVGLKADGRLVYKKTWDEIPYDDGWLKPVLDWADIVRIEYKQGWHNNILLGVTADGTIKIANGKYEMESARPDDVIEISSSNYDFINSLSGVKDIHIKLHKTYTEDLDVKSFSLNIVALTNQGKVLSYIDGVTNEVEDSNVVDADFATEYISSLNTYIHTYVLKSTGELVNTSTNKIVLQDVVYVDDSIIITRNGSVYTYEEAGYQVPSAVAMDVRSVVYDEWIERMK